MKLDTPITLRKPPETYHKGNRVEHPEFTLDELNPVYTVHTKSRYVGAYFEAASNDTRIEGTLVVVSPSEYSEEGSYTPNFLDSKLKEVLGSDPQSVLQGLYPKTVEQDPEGPGAILTNMIKSIGIVSSSSCSCCVGVGTTNSSSTDCNSTSCSTTCCSCNFGT